jgi:lipoyl synthase
MSCQTEGNAPALVTLVAAPELTPPTAPNAGMRARLDHFGAGVEFYAPGLKRWQTSEWQPEKQSRFLPLSVTGTECALQCDHCATKVLEGMIPVSRKIDIFETARDLKAQGAEGVLVSGGSTKTGEVPLFQHLAGMRRIRDELGLKVIVHSGVVTPELAKGLAEAEVDGVMLDIIGDDETIRQVYHLDRTAADFERSIELLAAQGMMIIPHIVVGLHYGQLKGEWAALEMIQRYPVSTLILVVLTPLVGTRMGHLQPPPVEEVTDFFALSRERLPDTPVNLGCGRPMGAMKVALDKAAIDHGLNGIAYPAEGIIEYSRDSGLEPHFYEYCCSLTWTGM